MKIGIVLVSGGWGGAEKVVYKLIEALSESKKLSITLFLNNEIIKHYINIKNIGIVNLGNYSTKSRLSTFISCYLFKKKLVKYLKKYEQDIINPHMDVSNFISPAKRNNIPVFHGNDLKNFKEPPSLIYKMFFYPNIKRRISKSDEIISVSYHQIANLQEKYKNKTVVIPNGVDSNIFKLLKNIKQKKNIIFFAGRYIDIKGIREIINVAKQLPQYEFWFAGQGPLANEIRWKNIKNLGFKTTGELVELYNQATICIFPSWHEPFGLVGLEAMSCQRAVIATPLGFSEYIENSKDGIIIPAKDEKALKDAIVDLMINERKRRALERNARKKALKYSWDKVAKQYLKVFKQVIKENKQSSLSKT